METEDDDIQVTPADILPYEARLGVRDWDRYRLVINALLEGKSEAEAASRIGVTKTVVGEVLMDHPALLEAIRRVTRVRAAMADLKAAVEIDARLDQKGRRRRLSMRDLIDIHRTMKPKDDEGRPELNVIIPAKWVQVEDSSDG